MDVHKGDFAVRVAPSYVALEQYKLTKRAFVRVCCHRNMLTHRHAILVSHEI